MPQLSSKRGGLLALTLVSLLGLGRVAEAGLVTYTEVLDDINDFPNFLLDVGRNMERTRTLGNGDTFVEHDDPTIDAQNNVSSNFGVSSDQPITYTHFFIANPPMASFQIASLKISAYSVSGKPDSQDPIEEFFQFFFGLGTIPDDFVSADGIMLGALVPGGPLAETTFEVSGGSETTLAMKLLDDNSLNIRIVPDGTGLFGLPDTIAVRTSELSVTYLAPAPGTVSLLLLGLPLLVASTRRRLLV